MLKVSQLASRLNLSESKIYEMVEKGEIEHHRIGGAIRFTEENLNALLEETRRERRERQPRQSKPRRPLLKTETQWF